jgi:diaminohydroxyphosphoribosylaminopyrimidine deaminase / 5-amino-6-(5-phosphoribosylamino)uracil reductase
MGVAVALAERGLGQTAPNPSVGCVIVRDNRVVGRGWTQPGGRPHAEAAAVAMAGGAARGATAYVTLEPCAHLSDRGPACADVLINAGVARVVVALADPDPRTDGAGLHRVNAAGIAISVGVGAEQARRANAGFLTRLAFGRPRVTAKLATSLDGCIALASGESKWITEEAARAHAHLERARCDMMLVGRRTYDADQPRLDVRLPGLEGRAPRRAVLSHAPAPEGWTHLNTPDAVSNLDGVNDLLVEGGAGAVSAFLAADLVDRLFIYRAPFFIGGGKAALGDIGLERLGDAHGRWRLTDTRMLGSDRLEVYEVIRG